MENPLVKMELFLIIVSFTGVLSMISCADKAEELNIEIDKVEALINKENEKNKNATEMIANLNAQMEEDLASLQIHDDTIREGVDKQMALIIKYNNDLIEIYKEEEELLKEIEELEMWTNLHNNKLDLYKQDYNLLVTRRNEGTDLECQKHMSSSAISTRSLRPTRNDVLVYSTLLQRLETDLHYAIKRHELLQREVEHKLQLSADIKTNLEDKIAHSTDDLVTLGSSVTKIKKELDQAQENVGKLRSRIYVLEKSKKSIEAQINQVVDDLKDYERDLVCLKKMSRNVETRRLMKPYY